MQARISPGLDGAVGTRARAGYHLAGAQCGPGALQERLAPVFERLFDFVQELMGDGAVDHTVIVA
jgi:hypothetical protein